ncbi:hypothetical protein Trydic_g19236 [Trypoxylus dichotomus]
MEFQDKLLALKRSVILPSHLKNYTEAILPVKFDDYKEDIENFEIRDDDIWVASFPRSGTTWTQEMVWLMVNNCNYEGAKEPLDLRYGFIELLTLVPSMFDERGFTVQDPIAMLNNTVGRRRFVKTHLPWELLPLQIRNGTKKPKIIYIMRNIKDVVVSWFHHNNILEDEYIELDIFFDRFITDNHVYSPYWKNICGFWNKRHLSNILLLQYEDMIRDLSSVIHRTASFLDTKVPEKEMGKLLRHLNFAEMKNNKAVNMEPMMELLNRDIDDRTRFIRKGKVGSHKEELTEEMIQLLDVWSEMSTEGTGFKSKLARVRPVLKNGDISDVSNCRPISIPPNIAKAFESAVYNILSD